MTSQVGINGIDTACNRIRIGFRSDVTDIANIVQICTITAHHSIQAAATVEGIITLASQDSIVTSTPGTAIISQSSK